jgi:primosomal protein N' (replication factor Y)
VQNLGVLIIDEEHDGSYYSESNPRFFTHDVAQMRCKHNGCALVLGSATPSVETYYKATVAKDYKLLTLQSRVGDIKMPSVEIVDMVAELRSGHGGLFSRAFVARLLDTVAAGKQAMVFLNRRGFVSHVMCKSCAWVAKCDSCDVSMVYHKEDGKLKCHYCGGVWTDVTTCKKCGTICEKGYLLSGKSGTQKLVAELSKMLPDVPIFRMDADNTKTKDSLVDILDEFGRTSPAILVGTQMIAKGHHFPDVSLVGIVDTDNSLYFQDYRAAERTFALVTQVAGRAGRAGVEGHVVLQTFIPSHYVYRFAANYDYIKFFDKEINTREVTKYPPFTTIARVLVTGEVDVPIKSMLQEIMKTLRTRTDEFIYLGAMKSPVGRIQNKFRYQILMRFPRHKEREVLDFVDKAVKSVDIPRNVHVFLEINPQNLS